MIADVNERLPLKLLNHSNTSDIKKKVENDVSEGSLTLGVFIVRF